MIAAIIIITGIIAGIVITIIMARDAKLDNDAIYHGYLCHCGEPIKEDFDPCCSMKCWDAKFTNSK